MTYRAGCSCGQLRLTYSGEILRTSICHCLACQKRTGSVFGVQVRLDASLVSVSGDASVYQRTGDAGSTADFHFCPKCGATLYWKSDALPDAVSVGVGMFQNPQQLAPPHVSVYEERIHSWVTLPDDVVDHYD